MFLHASELVHAKRDSLGFCALVTILEIHDFSPLEDLSDDGTSSSLSDSSSGNGLPGSGGGGSLRPWSVIFCYAGGTLAQPPVPWWWHVMGLAGGCSSTCLLCLWDRPGSFSVWKSYSLLCNDQPESLISHSGTEARSLKRRHHVPRRTSAGPRQHPHWTSPLNCRHESPRPNSKSVGCTNQWRSELAHFWACQHQSTNGPWWAPHGGLS
jgi:hypothetical protein